MGWLPAAIVGVVLLLVLFLSARAFRSYRPGGAAESPVSVEAGGLVTAVLELEDVDPDSPAVQRLVHDTAARLLAALPDATEVEVRTPGGQVLGRVTRKAVRPHPIALPEWLSEPHSHRGGRPDISGHLQEDEPDVPPPREGRLEVAPVPVRPPPPVADRFELPEAVRQRIRNPEDPVEVVRAILEAAGIPLQVRGDLILAGDQAVAVITEPTHGRIGERALNHGFFRIKESRARRGLVVAFGLLDPTDIRRRGMLAPDIQHVGPDGVQRMADAVALGADPLRFAVAPPLATPTSPVP
jgi:hypothetical protein